MSGVLWRSLRFPFRSAGRPSAARLASLLLWALGHAWAQNDPPPAVAARPALAAPQGPASSAPSRPQEGLAAAIPLRRDGTAAEPGAVGVLWPVAGLAALFAVLAWAARARPLLRWQTGFARGRSGRRPSSADDPGAARLLVLQSARLGPSHSLHVVQWQGRQLLVGASAGTCCVLAQARAVQGDGPNRSGP